jgi:hypothetical protein
MSQSGFLKIGASAVKRRVLIAHNPHFSQKVRSPTPEALQNLGFDWVIAL